MKFYPGLHIPSQAQHFARAFISINRVRNRKKPVNCGDWILDSGAFSELARHGAYRHDVQQYAVQCNALAAINPGLTAAVSQDWMCENFILARTSLTIDDHQRLTIDRYDALKSLITGVYLMPVLQGYSPQSYIKHLSDYGPRLDTGTYVGIGSICKRNTDVVQIELIVRAIKNERPDLRLHAFGLKATALRSAEVRDRLYSADSMAWSWAARKEGGDANDWREASRFARHVETMAVQTGMGW